MDDIQIDLRGGARVYIQAKSTVLLSKRNKALRKAVIQFVEAVTAADPPGRADRLVLAVSRPTEGIDALFSALRRSKYPLAGHPTQKEQAALRLLGEMTSLGPEQIATIVAITSGLPLTPDGTRLAQAMLGGGVVKTVDAPRAFSELKSIARDLAKNRYGLTIDEWAERLRIAKVPLIADESGTASGRWEARRRAVRRYRANLVRKSRLLDLRSLGAAVPALPHRIQALTVLAGRKRHGDRDIDREVDLRIAARRQHRLLLLGLPGGGKTTALKYLAAQWARDPRAPLPLLISLREAAPLLASQPPFRVIVDVALRHIPTSDAALVREEIEQRSHDGRLALLFDGLDETRELRFKVVEELEHALNELSRDTTVILSTRDSGYAAASTLNFADAQLKHLRAPTSTLRQVVKKLGKTVSGGSQSGAWVEERLAWIDSTLDRDRALAETPLGGILLALLAAEPSRQSLPSGRSHTLSAVVDSIVDRWELSRRSRAGTLQMGMLTGSIATDALRKSFAEIGRQLVSTSTITSVQVIQELGNWLVATWGVSVGAAPATARDLFGFWDEAGVFIASAASGIVAPRLQLLAEIGAARAVAALPKEAIESAVGALASREETFEVASLAAGLSDLASRTLTRYCLSQVQLGWDLKAARHLLDGAPHTGDAGQVVSALAAHLSTGSVEEQWNGLKAIARLPAPITQRLSALDGLQEQISSHDYLLSTAMAQSSDCRMILNAAEVIEAAEVRMRRNKARPGHEIFISLHDDDDLADLLAYLAERSLPSVSALAPGLLKASDEVHHPARSRIEAALVLNGHSNLLKARNKTRATAYPAMAEAIEAWDNDWRTVLQALAGHAAPKTQSFVSQWRLDELSDFLSTLRLDVAPAGAATSAIRRNPAHLDMLFRLCEGLGGFDVSRLAAEATRVLELDAHRSGGSLAVLHGGRKRPLDRWDSVEPHGARLLIELLDGTDWTAQIASEALAHCPEAGIPDQIERRLSHLPPINRVHAAWAVTSIENDDLTRVAHWASSPDPFLRMVASWKRSRALKADELLGHAKLTLIDSDRGVRAAAIQGMRGRSLTHDVRTLLSDHPAAHHSCAFACIRCGHQNDGGDSCAQCKTVGPDPGRQIRAALAGEPDDTED